MAVIEKSIAHVHMGECLNFIAKGTVYQLVKDRGIYMIIMVFAKTQHGSGVIAENDL